MHLLVGKTFCSLPEKPQGSFQLILHARTFPMPFELVLSLSLLIVEHLASSSGKLLRKVFHILSPNGNIATLQLAPLIYVYFKLISRCSDLIKCWQESCENTFILATCGSKSLKPKNNNTHKGRSTRKRNEQRRRRRWR